MNSAEEVFANVMTLLNLPVKFERRNGIPESTYEAVKAEIVAFAESFARELVELKVKELLSDRYWLNHFLNGKLEGRNEALEEAAKRLEKEIDRRSSEAQITRLVELIRALKGKV